MKKLIILVFCLSLTGCMWNMFGGGGGGGDSDSGPDASESISFQLVQSYAANGTVSPEFQWSDLINITNDKKLTYKREVGDNSCQCNKNLSDDEFDELATKVEAANITEFEQPDSEDCQYMTGSSVSSVGLKDEEGEKFSAYLICATDSIKELNDYIKGLACSFSSDCALE
ncbi:MAG: hypothetical protein HN337_09535 [Deltaproteobacteria bacterium]|jgi:hypothetical protein|nr:hypothetical protein [Deltaproteobacteria bacterium]